MDWKPKRRRWARSRIVGLLRHQATRFAAYFSAFCFHSWFLWPNSGWSFQAEPFFALLIAICAVLVTELAQYQSPPSAHDIDLYRQFRAKLSDATLREAKELDLGNAFETDTFKEFQDIRHTFVGARYEFVDGDVKAAFERFRAANGAFLNALSVKTFPHPVGANFVRVNIEIDENGLWSDRTHQTIGELNDLATALHQTVDDLERVAIEKLHV